MVDVNLKVKALREVCKYREKLKKTPQLRYLFLELTSRCNERCLHCGSSCTSQGTEKISPIMYRKVLQEVKEDFVTNMPMICITGGEPLLRKDFFEITDIINNLGFNWGMTSNGTLISKDIAEKLYKTGMKTISVSIDGLEKTHDEFRQTPGGFKRTMEGINNLLEIGKFQAVQITTVVTKKSINELDSLYEIFDKMPIDSWRIINIEPMGRALDHPELLLDKEDYIHLFEFIRNKRLDREPVCYGCSHYLGMEYEGEVRDWMFMCLAGIRTASITSDGDIIGCLDIERRSELVQGNIFEHRFSDIWKNKFKPFRQDLSQRNSSCQSCPEKDFCHGGSFHSWDFDQNKPKLCFKNILF